MDFFLRRCRASYSRFLHFFEDVLVFQIGRIVLHTRIGRILLRKLDHPPPVPHRRDQHPIAPLRLGTQQRSVGGFEEAVGAAMIGKG